MKIFLLIFFLAVQLISAKIYKGAELRTIETYTYGRIEARFKPAEGNGIVASLFTYHEIRSLAEWNEIDIEILGRYMDDVQLTTIIANQLTNSSHFATRFKPHADYHTYSFEWTPHYVAWFIDGIEVYRQTGAQIQTLNLPQKIMMNLWVAEGPVWAGDWNENVLPRFSYYDWVSYAAYTPGAGSTGTNSNFTLKWRDDFDSLNTSRWQRATHTWAGNLVDFTPDNVVFKDGKMILCLTDENHTGLIDKNPPSILWARLQGDSVYARFSENIDPNPAKQTANYGVGTFQVLDARLLPDSQTVSIKVQPDTLGASSLVAFNMADLASPPNVQVYALTDLITASPLNLPVKINTGSGGSSTQGVLADQVWGPGVEYGHMDGYNQLVNNYNVNNPNMDDVFQFELANMAKYKVRLEPGNYNIDLSFSESQYQQPGKRQFDVVMEDSVIASQLDLEELAGLHQPYTVSVSDFPVRDGILDIHFTNWIDKPLINAIYIYQTPTSLQMKADISHPSSMALFQNYPNPFNPRTHIAYSLNAPGMVTLDVFNIQGERIKRVMRKQQVSGNYSLNFNASDLASGIYIYRMRMESAGHVFQQSHKMMLIR